MESSVRPGIAASIFERARDSEAELWLVYDPETQHSGNARLAMSVADGRADWVTEWFFLPSENIMGLSYTREERPKRYRLTETTEEERDILFAGVTLVFRLDAPPDTPH
jgi:hypothetical protein